MRATAIVILNYNGETLLPRFLPSVIKYSPGADIYVADNASTDNSVEILRKQFPQVKVIQLEQNFGFCGGYNRALREVRAKYFVLLNSDVEVTEGWLEPLRNCLESDPTIAAVQPKILSYDHRDRFEYAGAGGGFIDSLGYPFCRGRLLHHIEKDNNQYNDTREVFWASGACFMIRSTVFQTFGGFDESYFAHMEEIDLCWRIQRSDYRIFYCGSSTVYHLGAGTLSYASARKTYLNFRNGLMLLFKHLGGVELAFKLPVRIVLDWVAALSFLAKGSTRNFTAVLSAHWDFLKSLRSLWRRRSSLHRNYPWYNARNIYKGSILLAYYVRGQRTLSVNNPR